MLGRSYRAPINIPAFTAQLDIFELTAASTTPFALVGFNLGQPSEVGDAQEEQLVCVLKYVTGAPTPGSGGATVTPGRCLPGDAAAVTTVKTGNTTKLTGGTVQELARPTWNVRQDFPVIWIPEMWQVCAPSARIVLELAKTPADQIDGLTGSIELIELV